MSSDNEPLEVAVMPVALAIQWPVQIRGVKDVSYSEIAHHFYMILWQNPCYR